jgi:hypothetical protein
VACQQRLADDRGDVVLPELFVTVHPALEYEPDGLLVAEPARRGFAEIGERQRLLALLVVHELMDPHGEFVERTVWGGRYRQVHARRPARHAMLLVLPWARFPTVWKTTLPPGHRPALGQMSRLELLSLAGHVLGHRVLPARRGLPLTYDGRRRGART